MYIKKIIYTLPIVLLSILFIPQKAAYANNIDEFICLHEKTQQYLNSIKKAIVNIDFNPGGLMTLTFKDGSKIYIQPGAGCLVGVIKQ